MIRIIQNLFQAIFGIHLLLSHKKIEKETFYDPLECIRQEKVIEIQMSRGWMKKAQTKRSESSSPCFC